MHEDLAEEVYIDPRPGIERYSNITMVCMLKKTLCELKKYRKAWFGRFKKSMKNFSYKQSNSDHTLFFKNKYSKVTALIIYVDGMVVTSDDLIGIDNLQKHIAFKFEMKKIANLKYFLGVEAAR